jgi:hypothetical protein
VYGDEERGAGDQIAVVEVTRMDAGRRAVDASRGWGRSNAHAAEERTQRDGNTGREERHHAVAVQLDDAAVALFEIFLQESGSGAEAVVRPRHGHCDFIDVEFEDVAGFGVLDEDGACENVPAGAAIERGFGDGAKRFGDLIGGEVEAFESGDACGAYGFDGNGIAGFDGEDRLGFGPVVADDYGFGSCGQAMLCGRERRGEE